MKKLLLLMLLVAGSLVMAEKLPAWGMTETQYKMPNFTTKMQKIGDQAVKNNWLLKITAPKDWHSKIRSALSKQGAKNVQINFKDSLYKSITITATPGMNLKLSNNQSSQPVVAKKQVIIEKPEIDTEIEAPEFENNFKANDILSDMDDLELTLPGNGTTEKNPSRVNKKPSNQSAQSDNNDLKVNNSSDQSNNFNSDKDTLKDNLRKRHARNKAVDKTISYANITDEDDLYVAGDVVLVKRHVNRGVAVYYWMKEAYDPRVHQLIEKGSGKFVKSDQGPEISNQKQASSQPSSEQPDKQLFDFVAVSDNPEIQNQLRRDFIRNKAVNSTLKASQLKSKDILYVSEPVVLVERPLGNSRSAYYWLEGEIMTDKKAEQKGPQKYVIE